MKHESWLRNETPVKQAVRRAGSREGFGETAGMKNVGNVVVTIVVAVVVCLVGILLYRLAGFSRVEAGLTVVCLILGAAQIVNMIERGRSVPDLEPLREQVSDLSQTFIVQARDIEKVRAELDALSEEHRQDSGSRNDQMASQMGMLETLVKQLAEGVEHRRAEPGERDDDDFMLVDLEEANATAIEDAALLSKIRKSLDENRVDLYLQPIVTLPQRKTRYYEGLSRLRSADGEIILPSDYLKVAENAGMMPIIDNLLLFRCVQVVRRMVERNREIGVFCNISPHSLLDAEFFSQFVEFMQHNTDLKDSLVFEFAQRMVDAFGPLELESLDALRELGFSFSMDRVTNLDINAEALEAKGFRYVKVDCELLLNRERSAGAQIHPADLSELLKRRDLELIVEKVESEKSIVDLLDYGINFAQGYLFAEPRPVRSEVLSTPVAGLTGTFG